MDPVVATSSVRRGDVIVVSFTSVSLVSGIVILPDVFPAAPSVGPFDDILAGWAYSAEPEEMPGGVLSITKLRR